MWVVEGQFGGPEWEPLESYATKEEATQGRMNYGAMIDVFGDGREITAIRQRET